MLDTPSLAVGYHSGREDIKVSPACPCCGGTSTDILYRVPSIPVHSCVLLDTPAAASSFPKRDLELAFCDDCGFTFNHIFDEALMRYSTDFEESQHFSDTFNGFARQLAAEIASRCDIASKLVLEIGCGKGEFLAELCDVGKARGLGIDPGFRADAGRASANARLEFIVDHFGPRYADLVADVVMCRHTLEHIRPVSQFIADIRQMLAARDDAWVVFETPDFKRVLEEGAFWDIYYEHCSYFSPGAHARLFREQGFEVTDLALVYSSQYIVQYARPAAGRTRPHLPLEGDLDEVRGLAEGFGKRVQAIQKRWRDRIGDAHAAGRRVVLWGGGSKAVSLLTTLGLTDEVQAAVDINPYKQGKYIPGTGHPVIAPQALTAQPPDLVVVMNPIYAGEVRKALAALDLYPEVLAV
jgi:SAM-dependent methyltransferase